MTVIFGYCQFLIIKVTIENKLFAQNNPDRRNKYLNVCMYRTFREFGRRFILILKIQKPVWGLSVYAISSRGIISACCSHVIIKVEYKF